MQKTIEVVYEDGVFKPLEPVEMEVGTKVKVEIKDTSLLKKRLQKYKGILKVKISSEELNELYHEYVTERTDIPWFKRYNRFIFRWRRCRKDFRKNNNLYGEFSKFSDEFEIEFLIITEEVVEITSSLASKYKLLPNDALIAATCKQYGITKIATFDADFERVDFLEVITPEWFYFFF